MPFYMVGAFGRVVCLAGVAAVLAAAKIIPAEIVVVLFFVLWTTYSFISGIVAVTLVFDSSHYLRNWAQHLHERGYDIDTRLY